ncbi:class I SAM-dependent methyltransferase [Agromyces sp. H3Y2-19a]|uniref:class I SAM-dependent methyltransferase n=1 Tax=Agromyces chromiiresistens TaxID=3030835 RepID=UPI0023BA11F4|nr:class I SAM-dependent methyltransferase [Agromyces chromiiresistens]MDF0512956.1 class I SAM-dependent methyltransferase [Agromyces chromiiresistens]
MNPLGPENEHAARSFGSAASVYHAARPGYPAEAVAWLVGDAKRVLDLGAGTGKLTQALVELDREVIAVDPVEEMLDELEIAVPGVPRILGTAEDIPIEDDAVDAVVVGQAWHWFIPERAVPEIARVLRPDGVLGLVWNSRDTSVGWLREAGEIMQERHDASAGFEEYVRIGAPFGPIEEHTVAWAARMSRDGFLDLVRSRSTFITAGAAEQADTIAKLEELLARHPDLVGRDELEVPYLTRCFRARLA